MYSHQMQFTAYKQGGNRINYRIENCGMVFFRLVFVTYRSISLTLERTLSAFHSLFGQGISMLSNRAHQLIQVRCCTNKYTICVCTEVNIYAVHSIH